MAHIDKIFNTAKEHNWEKVKELIIQYDVADELDNEIRDNKFGNTLLHQALIQGEDKTIITELIKYIDINALNNNYQTPLQSFVLNTAKYRKEKQEEMLTLLLDNGADPNMISYSSSSYGYSPFLMACFMNIPKRLIELMKLRGGNLDYVKKLYSNFVVSSESSGTCDQIYI